MKTTLASFDALSYFEKLKSVGIPDKQAQVQANAFRDLSAFQMEQYQLYADSTREISSIRNELEQKDLATKADLRETELRLQKEIKEVELRLQKQIKEVELQLQKQIKEVELELQKQIKEVENQGKATELRLQKEIEKSKYALLKWQFAIGLALAAIMAKGFNWLGF